MNDKITEIKEALAFAKLSIENFGAEVKMNPEMIDGILNLIETLETQSKALEFYADPESWRLKHIKGNVYFSAVHEDTGEKAREALSII